MRRFVFVGYLLALVGLAAGCQTLLGDFELEERNTGCTSASVQCVGNVLQVCHLAKGWENVAVCASETLCDETAGECELPACMPGERRCVEAELQICNGTRDGWTTVDTCATAGHCSPETGRCMDVPCEPGKIQCNGAALQSCKNDRSGWNDIEPCESAALCDAARAACNDPSCGLGDFQCLGAELQSCSTSLDGWTTVKVCDSDALCDATSGSCGQGGCTSPGAFRCSGEGLLERCNDELTGWEYSATCLSVAHCDTVLGACTAGPCSAGMYQCNGATLESCNASRNGRDPIATCETDGLCQLTLKGGLTKCEPPQCDPGAFRCNGVQPQVCNAARTEFRDNGAPCATPELCNDVTGMCNEPVCGADQTRCNEGQPEICNPGRTGFMPNGPACATVALCNLETGTCGDQACTTGLTRCDPEHPTHLQRCNDDLDGWTECDICATSGLCTTSVGATSCDQTSCNEPTCSLTDTWCGGTEDRTLYKCPASRISAEAQALDVCATAGLCDEALNAGQTTCDEPSCALTDLWCGGTGSLGLYKCPPSRINTEATLLDTCETNGLCEQAHSANAMTCPDPACALGQTQCGGTGNRTLRMCRSDRTDYQDCDTCDTSALCTDSLSATTCNASACHICVTGQKQCSSSQLQVCNATHDGWTNLALCASSALCMSSLTPAGQMTCDACTAGSHGCNGAQPQVCNDPGTGASAWADDGAACDAATLCDQATGTCICSLTATRCNPTSNNFETCEASGWVETAVCTTGCDAMSGCLGIPDD